MKTENRSFTHKRKTYHGTIVWPDDLAEAIRLLGERDTWSAFRLGYLELCKRQICGITPRRRSQRIDLGALPPEAQDLVRELIDRILADGAEPVGSSPEEFTNYLRAETAKWAKVVQAAGIKPE